MSKLTSPMVRRVWSRKPFALTWTSTNGTLRRSRRRSKKPTREILRPKKRFKRYWKSGKSVRVRWSQPALQELDDASEFIGSESPRRALRFIQSVYSGVEPLTQFPSLGRPGRVAGTRELVISGTLTSLRIASAAKSSRSSTLFMPHENGPITSNALSAADRRRSHAFPRRAQ